MPLERDGEPPLFVSYASSDRCSRDVIERLKAQPLGVWDFRSSDQRLPVGADVEEACRTKVAQSSGLVLIATRTSLGSPSVIAEVEAALQMGSAFPIITFLDQQLGPSALTERFSPLSKRIHFSVDFERREGIERAVADLCVHRRVEHRGPKGEWKSFPFIERLYEELKEVGAFRQEYESSTYYNLMRIAERVLGTFERGDYAAAESASRYLLSTCEHEFPGRPLYFAPIMSALCEHALGRSRLALSRLLEIERSKRNPRAEGEKSLEAALAKVHYDQHEFDEAARRYQRAIAIKDRDVADHCSLLLSRVKARALAERSGARPSVAAVDIDASLRDIEQRATDDDRHVVEFTKAVVYRIVGRQREAEAAFVSLLEGFEADRSQLSPSGVVPVQYADCCYEYADLLVREERFEEAETVLKRALGTDPENPLLLMRLADAHSQAGQRNEALRRYRQLGQLGNRNLAAGFTALRGLYLLQAWNDAEVIAESMLPPRGRVPNSPDDFFFAGAANCILGRPELARYDFERSGNVDERWLDLAEQRRRVLG